MRRILRINEAVSVDDEYTRNYSSIDREIFDNIVLADPRTRLIDGKPTGIGFGAKSLLLPAYKGGEVGFYQDLDKVSKALTTFYSNQSSYDPQFRNLSNFSSVEEFISFVDDPENFSSDSFGKGKEKKNPIDDIYDKYYSDIERDIFDKIIALDPKTDENRLGGVVKNLILPKYLSGEKDIVDDLDEIGYSIREFYSLKDSLPADKQKIESFKSIKEFVEYMTSGPESDFITRLKENPNLKSDEWELVTSDFNYDVIWIKSHNASVQVTYDNSPRSSQYLTWCTGYRNDSYHFRNYSSSGYLYDFIYKKDNKDRTMNYQLCIYKNDYKVRQFLDGNDTMDGQFNAQQKVSENGFEAFLYRNPKLAEKLIKVQNLKENDVVKRVDENLKLLSKPFLYNGPESLYHFNENNLSKFVKELTIDGVESIPAEAFYGCLALEKINFTEGLKKIGNQAFMYCKSLSDMVLPESLEEIGSEAFAEDISLRKNLKLPNNLVEIGREAFRGTFCKVTVDKKRTKRLHIDPADIDWFKERHKAITVQEDLNESILDENIPPDLARAYHNATLANSGSQINPSTRHGEVGGSGYRRGVAYDYANSNYTEISKDEAKRIGRREKDKINELRFILGGHLIEFELRGNRLHQTYWTNIPQEVLGDVQILNKNGEPTTDSKYAKYETIVDLADKIYKTDEYEHRITDETPTKRVIGRRGKISQETGEVVTDDEGRVVTEPVYDTVGGRRERSSIKTLHRYTPKDSPNYSPHSWKTNYLNNPIFYNTNPDTGSHRRNIFGMSRGDFYRYEEISRRCDGLYKIWNNLVRKLKKLTSDRDLYDPQEFLEDSAELQVEIDNAKRNYQEGKRQLRVLKDKLVKNIDSDTQKSHDKILSLLSELQEKLDRIYSIKGELTNLRYQRISDSDNEDIRNAKQRLENFQDRAKEVKSEIEKLKVKIEELTKQLNDLTEKLNSNDSDLMTYMTQITSITQELDNLSNIAIKEKFEEIDKLEREKSELEQQVKAVYGKVKGDSSKGISKKEIDPSIKDLIDFSSEEEEVESTDGSSEEESDEKPED